MWRASRRGNEGLLRVIVLVDETSNKRPGGQGTPYTMVLTLASAFWPFGQRKSLSKGSERLRSSLDPSVGFRKNLVCCAKIFFYRGPPMLNNFLPAFTRTTGTEIKDNKIGSVSCRKYSLYTNRTLDVRLANRIKGLPRFVALFCYTSTRRVSRSK